MREFEMVPSRGDPGIITLKKVEMEDPNFESETVHVAHVTFTNPKAVAFSYEAELYLGKVLGDKKATSGVGAFSIPAGGSLPVDFTVSMPRLLVVQDSYHVYLAVAHAGITLVTYVSTEDVLVFVTPAVEIGIITWD